MQLSQAMAGARRRQGFTLIEILVVVAIILILTALSAAGYFYWIGGQQQRNTEGTIRTVYKTLQSQWAWVIDEAKKEDIGVANQSGSVLNNLAAPDPTGERARLIWIRARLMEAFPMTVQEALNPPSIIPSSQQKYIAAYTRYLNARTGATNANAEASLCLLMALTVGRGGRSISADDLGSAAVDTDGDGVKEIVDGWRQPIGFHRFATSDPGMANPAAAGSKSARFGDPLDPSGLLLNPGWYQSKARGNYETGFGYAISGDNGSTAFYVIPVIFSGGPDLKLGSTADNIYSYQLP